MIINGLSSVGHQVAILRACRLDCALLGRIHKPSSRFPLYHYIHFRMHHHCCPVDGGYDCKIALRHKGL